MITIAALIYFSTDTLKNVSKNNEFTSTGGIEPVYFLGSVLFIIFIMIALLIIRIANLQQNEIVDNKNKQE